MRRTETSHIRLLEVDAEGRVRASILFDLDDRSAAYVEALERFAAGEVAAAGELVAYVGAFRALSRHDWDELHRSLTADFVLVDHRALRVGTLDRDQPDGGPFENVFVLVGLTAGDRLERLEAFEVTEAEQAVARFEELCAARMT